MSGFLSDVGKAVSDGVDAAVKAVSDGVNAAAEAVSDGVNAAAEAVSDGVNAAAEAISDGVDAAAEAISDGVDAAGRAVSRGLGAVNNACNKANDSIEAIRETVVSSPDILADMIADSIVGQYWSDFWDLNVESVNAIEGILEDTAEELANDEDVPGFIRDYMNGLIGADVPCNFFGVLGAGCRGVEEMLSGVYKGTSGVLGHPCQTGENIADALIIAGEATKYFIEDPQKATENAISSVSDWWNDKTTYEKIRTVVEAYIMYRMIASSGSKGETVTLESEAAGVTEEAAKAGEVAEEAAKAGEVAEEAAKAGEVAEEAAKAGEVAEEAAKAGGKGKVKIESGIDSSLLDELASSGVKCNIDDVVAITKTADGKLVWLEKGNSKAGLEHIMQHADQFATKGIPKEKIPDFIIYALKNGKAVGTQRTRTIYEVMYEGKLQRVAISVGNNGFIVGANPKSMPK